VYEIKGALFIFQRDEPRNVAAAPCHSAFDAFTHLNIALCVNPVDPLVVCNHSVSAKKVFKPPAFESPTPGYKLLQSLKKRFVVVHVETFCD
jgi:hypothetical protein